RDDGASEAAAHHARSDGAGLVRAVHDRVERRGRDLEVVPQAVVALAEDPPERGEVARLERLDAPADTLVFGDDMTQPPPWDLVEPRRLDLFDRQLERSATGERSQAVLELRSPLRVAGVLEATARPRVEHDNHELLRQRHIAVLLGAAVE